MNDRFKLARRVAKPQMSGIVALLWFLCFAFASIVPIDPAVDPLAIRLRLQEFDQWDSGALALRAIVERIVTMGPLGFLLCRWLESRPVGKALFWALVLVLLAACFVEFGQLFLSARHGRLGDLLVASAAGCSGAVIRHLRGRRSWPFVRVPLTGNAIAIALVVWVEMSSSLATWDCRFPLAIGSEPSGDRPWVGSVDSVALYIGALGEPEAAMLAPRPLNPRDALRVSRGMIEFYEKSPDSRGLSATYGAAGTGDLVELPPPSDDASGEAGGGLDRSTGMMISETPASRFCQQAMAVGAFAVEAWIVSRDSSQVGPARIVTHSIDTGARNFTLGQQGDRLVFRVRTLSNINGSRAVALSDSNLGTDARRHVLATFSAGEVALFVDGRLAGPVVRLYDRLILAKRVSVPMWFVTGLVLSLTGALIAAMPFANIRNMAAAVLAVGLPTIVSIVVIALWRGHEPSSATASAAIIGPVAGAALVRVFHTRSHAP